MKGQDAATMLAMPTLGRAYDTLLASVCLCPSQQQPQQPSNKVLTKHTLTNKLASWKNSKHGRITNSLRARDMGRRESGA